jgi:hypothetical protein
VLLGLLDQSLNLLSSVLVEQGFTNLDSLADLLESEGHSSGDDEGVDLL